MKFDATKPAAGANDHMPSLNPGSNASPCKQNHLADKQTPTNKKESPMKLNRMMTLCAIAIALALGGGNVFAQNDGGGPGGPGGPGRGPGGPGGMGGFGGPGGFGGGNFDPAQMQQMMMQRLQEQLGITNDTEWSAIQPLVQKVMDAQRAAGGNMGRMFGRGARGGGRGGPGGFGGPGGPGGPGGFGQQSDPAVDTLQQALDNNAPSGQIKDLLEKYQASQKEKQAALTAAQEDLRKVLTVPQEAQATLMGLLN
jgi:hypothetical protein